MAQMIPFIMNPETRKASSNVGKILLVFGVLGVGIVAFIFLSKIFKPLEAVGKFFGNMFKGVGGFFKGALSGLGGVLGGVGKFFGGIFGKGKSEPEVILTAREVRGLEVQDWYAEDNEAVRREFRRYSTQVIRALDILKNTEGIPMAMAGRISIVESAFKKVNKTFVRDLARQFDNVWNRKVEFLKGNLIGGFERAEDIQLSKELAKAGRGYGAKMALAGKYM